MFDKLTGLRFGKKAREAGISLFTRELADLLAAGVSLPLSLSILHDRQKQGRLKNILHESANDVEDGAALSDALDKHKKVFEELSSQIVRRGEKSGRLNEALEALADFKQRQWAHAKAARKSLGRPLLLLLLGLALFIYMYVILLPAFTGTPGGITVYWWRRRPSPWPIAITLAFVAFLKSYLLTATVGGVLFVSTLLLLLKVRIVRGCRDTLVLRLPLFRRCARALAASQLVRPLAALVSLGASFPDALKDARHAIDNQSAAKAVGEMALDLEGGEALEDSVERLGLLPPVAARLLGKTGDADDPTTFLRAVANQCDDRLDAAINARSRNLTSVLAWLFGWFALWLILVIILINVS